MADKYVESVYHIYPISPKVSTLIKGSHRHFISFPASAQKTLNFFNNSTTSDNDPSPNHPNPVPAPTTLGSLNNNTTTPSSPPFQYYSNQALAQARVFNNVNGTPGFVATAPVTDSRTKGLIYLSREELHNLIFQMAGELQGRNNHIAAQEHQLGILQATNNQLMRHLVEKEAVPRAETRSEGRVEQAQGNVPEGNRTLEREMTAELEELPEPISELSKAKSEVIVPETALGKLQLMQKVFKPKRSF